MQKMERTNSYNKFGEFEKIITEFQDQLFRFAFFRTGCFEDSQDIVQEVFIKLYHKKEYFHSVKNIKSYLYKSISNACIDYQRKNRKITFESIDSTVQPLYMHENETLQNMIQIEEYHRLETILNELPNEQSETIRLKVFDDLSFVEIAEILEVPVTTIKSRFKYGIDKLRNRLEMLKEVNYEL